MARRRACVTVAPAFICGHIGGDVRLICSERFLTDAQWAAENQTINSDKPPQHEHPSGLSAVVRTQKMLRILRFGFRGGDVDERGKKWIAGEKTPTQGFLPVFHLG